MRKSRKVSVLPPAAPQEEAKHVRYPHYRVDIDEKGGGACTRELPGDSPAYDRWKTPVVYTRLDSFSIGDYICVFHDGEWKDAVILPFETRRVWKITQSIDSQDTLSLEEARSKVLADIRNLHEVQLESEVSLAPDPVED